MCQDITSKVCVHLIFIESCLWCIIRTNPCPSRTTYSTTTRQATDGARDAALTWHSSPLSYFISTNRPADHAAADNVERPAQHFPDTSYIALLSYPIRELPLTHNGIPLWSKPQGHHSRARSFHKRADDQARSRRQDTPKGQDMHSSNQTMTDSYQSEEELARNLTSIKVMLQGTPGILAQSQQTSNPAD